MMQGKIGWWIAGGCAAFILISIGYGMGRKAQSASATASSLVPAGAPLPTIQIEPIQPHQEIAAITAAPAPATAAEAALTSSMETSPAAPSLSTPVSPLPMEDSVRVKQIQQALKGAGLDPGPIDGRMGQRTKVAIRDFQTAHGLEPDGKVGPRTWSKLEPFLRQSSSTND